MRLRDLKQHCEERLRQVTIPDPFDLTTFCARLSADRGRPLQLLPFSDTWPRSPCGIWVPTATTDYVYVKQATSPLHREHNVLHELCHMILDHPASPELVARYRDRLLPDLSPDMVTRIVGRTTYSTAEEQAAEQEAEMLATLIGSRARRPRSSDVGLPPGTASALSRAHETLGPRQ